ncbi:MAG: glycoside hydrolase family 28 protein [Clostridia bacterium]|nr:glycoside hydrolase family 28 protein [Clostridia bacterium]
MEYKFFKPFELPAEPIFPDVYVSITDYGARENEVCTEQINRAIKETSQKGGGHIIIPKGKWKTGAIHLASNIELHFESGAVLDFSTNPDDYLPAVLVVYEGIRCINYSPFIYGKDLVNVAITGEGILEGNGNAFWEWKKNKEAVSRLYEMGANLVPVEERVFARVGELRSPFVQLLSCKNVLIDGIKLNNSPFWNVDPVWCENMIIRNVKIESPAESPNTDGINVDSCRNVLVEDCTVITAGDDLFCLKAGRNDDALEVGIPCENVIIRRCRSLGKCASGGIVIGSEMSAGVRNVLAYDCDFAHNINCVRVKSKDGRGGVVENIEVRNLHMGEGMRGINLTFRYDCNGPKSDDARVPGERMPVFRNIYAENIVCDKTDIGIAIDGVPNGVMENIYFKDISMNAVQCLSCDSVYGLNMENVRLCQIVKE